ncbi:probable serine/threonine-protein kinase At1g09600 [Cajanus cajan]|uniref:Serine/threonine-protein kinase At1g54610 family n=1 Tax=Cajanus cajan TaxID=3821 RepID=A0A151T836_CAJCA|nr:probable serine/threonine-protein kinase At1g09600 [Cajanus cajan]KYP63228.1 putative serine/threonine-protein kinase At1g54610 family [Cajanus cajan]
MGCICSKGKDGKESKHFPFHLGRRGVSENDTTARLISNGNAIGNGNGTEPSTPVSSDEQDKNKNTNGVVAMESTATPRLCRVYSVTRGERGAQVLAGWPSWLTAVAGEAISGWVPRRADSFEKLDKIGQGTYSSVYRARDLETNTVVALKKVRFANMDPESVRFMSREIIVLRRLDHPNVMKLLGMITSRVSGSLYLIFEYMEHDLAGLAAIPGIKFTETQIKCYMQQLLCGLEHCHSRGVMHRDIKGSNLLLDGNGNLRIGDFGLATLFQPSHGQPLTSRVVTLWYRPPELLLGATDYGVSVDLWSAGCILAELFVGKPIMPGRTEVEQLHKIFKLCGSPSEEYWKKSKLPHATIFKPQQPYKRVISQIFKDFPSSALGILDVLLAVEPKDRGTASFALQHEFFTANPLPCDPSTLPKYPPSKEFDAKIRDEEARRQRAANKGHEHESVGKNFRESKAVPIPDANAEFEATMGRQGHSKCNTEKYNPEEDGGVGYPREPAKSRALNVFSHSGQSMHPSVYGSSRNMNSKEGDVPDQDFRSRKSELRKQNSFWHGSTAKVSRFTNSVAVRGDSRLDMSGDRSVNSQWSEDHFGMRYNHLADGESNQLLNGPKSSPKKDFHSTGKDRTKGYSNKNARMHHSGPLLAPEDNLEEMLKEHERQIQLAIRKARLGKDKAKKADMRIA